MPYGVMHCGTIIAYTLRMYMMWQKDSKCDYYMHIHDKSDIRSTGTRRTCLMQHFSHLGGQNSLWTR